MDCAGRLIRDGEYLSDLTIPSLICLNQIGDDIRASFGLDEHDDSGVEQLKAQMLLPMLQHRLKDWKNRIIYENKLFLNSRLSQGQNSPNSYYTTSQALSHKFHEMELYLVGLPSQRRVSHSEHEIPDPANEMKRLDILMLYFEAGKSFLDIILESPVEQYRLFPFIEWMRLPYVLLKLCTLCTPNVYFSKIGWNVFMAQERARLDVYLDTLCERLQSLTTFNPPAQPKPDFFCSIKIIMEKTRHWYLRKTRTVDGEPINAEPTEESPLEVLRDPHEHEQSAHATGQDDHPRPTDENAGVVDSDKVGGQSPSENMIHSLADLGNSNGFFYDFDDSFWSSSFFNTEMFSEA